MQKSEQLYQFMIVPILTPVSLSLYGSTTPHIKCEIEKIEAIVQLIIGSNES